MVDRNRYGAPTLPYCLVNRPCPWNPDRKKAAVKVCRISNSKNPPWNLAKFHIEFLPMTISRIVCWIFYFRLLINGISKVWDLSPLVFHIFWVKILLRSIFWVKIRPGLRKSWYLFHKVENMKFFLSFKGSQAISYP